MSQDEREMKYPELVRDARTLLTRCDVGALSTLDPRDGIPYASLVEVMDDESGVWMCLSDLAAHSTNLLKDGRASILVREPLTHVGSALGLQRLTLMGRVEKMPRADDVVTRWIERHPGAQGYVHFSDFNFYRLEVQRARYVAGFGRMGWLDEATWRGGRALEWAASVQGIVAHMNEDHGQNLLDYVHALRGKEPERVSMLGVDELGCDVWVSWEDGHSERVRLMFEARAERVECVRKELVRMAHSARAQIAGML
jgi:putative heme iron utilization protein